MSSNSINYKFKFEKLIPVDEFVEKVLYHPKVGYYTKKIPNFTFEDFGY